MMDRHYSVNMQPWYRDEDRSWIREILSDMMPLRVRIQGLGGYPGCLNEPP